MKTAYSRKIETLVKLSAIINSSLDILEVLDNGMRFVEELVDVEASSIFEVDPASDELFFRVLRGEEAQKAKKIRMKFGEGVVGWVANSREAVIVPDASKDTRFCTKVDLVTGFKTRNIIALPIINKGELVGVLELINKRNGKTFDDKDLEILTIVANQIGIAMVNAKLYARLQKKFSLTRAELKKTQEQLIRSERLSALGELSQGVAHEVRNPIMSIGGFARRLQKKLQNDKILCEYVDIILKESARLEQMVKDIEDYTALPEAVPREIRLSELLQNALASWENDPLSAKTKIQLNTLPEGAAVYVDMAQLAQALVNLFRNSAEAMRDGGTIAVSTSLNEHHVKFSVRDNGPGIAPEDLPRVFDPFFTKKTRGTGLGLTTVNRIVTDHGGEVKMTSVMGRGTEFILSLPRFATECQRVGPP